MKKVLVAAVVIAAAGATANAQILVGAHSRIYTGYSRGFSYTANMDHTITAMDLPADGFTAGALASYAIGVNDVQQLYSMGNTGAITGLSVNVLAGDVVIILGNWTAGVPGSFTAVNSYSDGSAPYATTANGLPGFATDLYRAGFQSDIGGGTLTFGGTGGAFSGLTGSFGRIFVTVVPAPASLALLGLGGLVAIRRRR